MNRKAVIPLLLVACGLVVSACGTQSEGGTFYVSKSLGKSRTLVTSADVRLVTSTPVDYDVSRGRIKPKQIICAEPSPDLAKAVQKSFGLGAGLGVDTPGVKGQAAVSIAKARAESAAQLGERLATIQLLRDGLYRACEAYANGALSEVTYAVLLSRYDDTMVSMLMGELAAGAFGRSLATLSGSADASATAKGQLKSTLDTVETAEETATQTKTAAEQKEKEHSEAKADLQNKNEELAKAQEQDPEGDHSAKEQQVADARENVGQLKTESMIANETAANAKATATAVAAGAITRTQNPEIAKVLQEMQRNYIENINADALVVACITAMYRDKASDPSVLSKRCGDEENGILAKVVGGHHELLMALKKRENLLRDTEAFEATVKNVNNIKKFLEELFSEDLEALTGAKEPKVAEAVVHEQPVSVSTSPTPGEATQ